MSGVCSRQCHHSEVEEIRCRYRDVIRLDDVKQALEERGDGVLRRNNLLQDFGWSTVDLEFHQSLPTWHIATSICYREEFHKDGGPGYYRRGAGLEDKRWMLMSKSLSGHMMYLLVDTNSNMLPKGIARPRYSGTSREILRQLEVSRARLYDLTDKRLRDAFYEHLPENFCRADLQQIQDDISGLASGVKLGSSLMAMEDWSNKRRWEMMSKVWVEMLTYAACHCEWKEHAQALAQGGELLTYVNLISAHLGFSMHRAEDHK